MESENDAALSFGRHSGHAGIFFTFFIYLIRLLNSQFPVPPRRARFDHCERGRHRKAVEPGACKEGRETQ